MNKTATGKSSFPCVLCGNINPGELNHCLKCGSSKATKSSTGLNAPGAARLGGVIKSVFKYGLNIILPSRHGSPATPGPRRLSRRVTVPLGLAIGFFPMIGAWFTLRGGYSTRVRVISFGWLGFLTTLQVIGGIEGRPEKKSLNKDAAPVVRDALRELRGIYNSGWDGSVPAVMEWFNRNLHDPDSFKAEEWGPVIANGETSLVRCRYRAENALGAYVLKDKIFTINSSGQVTRATDVH